MTRQRLPAIAAQFTQALTSLALGMIAVRVLDPTGFGRYSLIISTLLVMTGLTTGLVGDTLTVLDRHKPHVRYALQVTALSATAACAAVVGFAGVAFGWFSFTVAPVVVLAVVSFLLEDIMRRALMANSRFVSVLVVDLTYALVAGSVLLASWRAGLLGLAAIFLAMAIGQFAAAIVAVLRLPHDDRYLAGRDRGGLRPILAFGGWRAAQGVIGPTRLWAARLLVAGAVGLAAVGTLEANRMLVAPVLLGVQGVGSAILVSYTRGFRKNPAALVKTADRDAATLIVGSVVCVGTILVSAPLLGRVLLGSTALVDRTAIFGWGLVAIGIAASLPYTNVTSVAGAPRAVVGIRVVDLALSLVGVSALLMATNSSQTYVWTPAVLGIVVCATAVAQRTRSRRAVASVMAAGASDPGPSDQDSVSDPSSIAEAAPPEGNKE